MGGEAEAGAADGVASAGPIRLLTFTTLFPHAGRPNHGVFVENRLRHLVRTGRASSVVVAPVPWFPSRSPRFGDWARHAAAGRAEQRSGLEVVHPRYLLLPKVGMLQAPAALFLAGLVAARRLQARGFGFDLIDGHYLYPDGVAAVALGRALGKKVVLTARGSDVTLYPRYAGPRRMLRWATERAAGLISVSAGLREEMGQLGIDRDRVTVLRNGVDLDLFRPVDAVALRRGWGAAGKVLLSVGHLIPRKRHDFGIEAVATLRDWTLVIVGEGPERGRLEALAARLGVSGRVIFAGAQPHSALPQYYSAADLLILASTREGWANVLLEAMACGTRVVASNIPGNPEVVQSEAAGRVVAENSAACFAETIGSLWRPDLDRGATRAYAEQFSWDATTEGQLALFHRVLGRSAQ